MFRRITRNPRLFAIILPTTLFSEDAKTEKSKTAQDFFNRNTQNETGWDRLHCMFTRDEFDNLSPELNFSIQSAFFGMFVGACYGGVMHSKVAYENFVQRNDATAFTSHLDAKKKLQDQVTVGFARGAFKWGWRLGFFTGGYVLLTTSISVYRGRSSLVEYIAAGGITGALYKCSLGMRGVAVGGGLGACLGGFAGLASLAILKMSGMTMEEIRFWQYQWKQERDRRFFKDVSGETNPLMESHNEVVGPNKIGLEGLDTPTETKAK